MINEGGHTVHSLYELPEHLTQLEWQAKQTFFPFIS